MNFKQISSKNLSKNLAYLLGVYLTDGSISCSHDKWGDWYNFSLKAIDKDFVENTLQCFKKINPECRAHVYEWAERERKWPNGKISKCQKQYCINVGFTKYKDFFINQTNHKHHIPYIIWDVPLQIKKWFIAGVMDGDGWISKKERKNYKNSNNLRDKYKGYQFSIGIGGVEEGWIHEFKELLDKMGVKTLKKQIDIRPPRVKPMVRFSIKIDSFVSHGLFFTIKRKQDRVKLLRTVQRLDVTHPMG